jgi:hypothetical protein
MPMPERGNISEPHTSSTPIIGSTPHGISTAFMPADSVGQRCLALVRELERSLHSGQAAWLAIEVQRTEQCTAEQARLCRELKTVLSHSLFPCAISPRGESRPDTRQDMRDLAAQLVAAATRVQRLARVQAALLRRSQRFLCVLANWMQRPDFAYGPPRAAGATLHRRYPIHREF